MLQDQTIDFPYFGMFISSHSFGWYGELSFEELDILKQTAHSIHMTKISFPFYDYVQKQ